MYKLLLVDDEQIIRDGIEKMINWNELGISLIGSCTNATSALANMMDNMPDILMTDVRMPGMDGLELAECAMTLHPLLRCIILSGFDEFAYAQRAIRAGAMEYLLKPCSQQEIENALLKACRSIDEIRARSIERFEERQKRVADLATRLNALTPDDCGRITPEQVYLTAGQAMRDPSQLRDALIDIVMKSPFGTSQVEWSFSAVQDAYNLPQQIVEHIAHTLTRIKGDQNERRTFVSQMIDFVKENYASETLSLQYIADQVVFMNADYIGKEFVKTMGMKFSAYLLNFRMQKAKAMLASDPQLHSYEIAERIGLGSNPHYFSQVFKKATGMTTKEYKNQLLLKDTSEK